MKSLLFFGCLISFLGVAQLCPAGTVETCAQYQSVTVGSYIVQTDYWNPGQCPGTQCLTVDDQTGAFSVTQATYSCGDNVAAYPDILFGCAFGNCSPQKSLPARLDGLKCVNSDWSFSPTNTGAWDAAYDIWVCPDNNCGPSGFNGGAEIMVWLDYRNSNGWQYDMGPVTLGGMAWEVWQFDGKSQNGQWKYVAYLAQTRTDSIRNLNLKAFLDDSQARGYVKPSWYLYAVEAGNEIHSGGIPFTSQNFSVSVNKDCGAKPVFTPLATFTPTATPDMTPGEIPPPP